jgi:hypothetical protein
MKKYIYYIALFFILAIGERMFLNFHFMMLICQPKSKTDVTPSFVLPAILVGILHNNG